jgi:hypothetical protein
LGTNILLSTLFSNTLNLCSILSVRDHTSHHTELIQAGGNTLHSEIHWHINSIWNKEGLQQCRDSIIVSIYKKGDKIDCNCYRGMLLLSAT